MINPYEKCPVYENEKYMLRMVKKEDKKDLLKVYSDEKAVPFFNSDNCGGDDFHYTTESRMEQAIEYWFWEYNRQGFVRWTIVSKTVNEAIGTIELFNRKADDYFNNCGLSIKPFLNAISSIQEIYNPCRFCIILTNWEASCKPS